MDDLDLLEDTSQSPKAGHGYSDAYRKAEADMIESYKSQSPKAGHGYSDRIARDELAADAESQSPKAGHGYSDRQTLRG